MKRLGLILYTIAVLFLSLTLLVFTGDIIVNHIEGNSISTFTRANTGIAQICAMSFVTIISFSAFFILIKILSDDRPKLT